MKNGTRYLDQWCALTLKLISFHRRASIVAADMICGSITNFKSYEFKNFTMHSCAKGDFRLAEVYISNSNFRLIALSYSCTVYSSQLSVKLPTK